MIKTTYWQRQNYTHKIQEIKKKLIQENYLEFTFTEEDAELFLANKYGPDYFIWKGLGPRLKTTFQTNLLIKLTDTYQINASISCPKYEGYIFTNLKELPDCPFKTKVSEADLNEKVKEIESCFEVIENLMAEKSLTSLFRSIRALKTLFPEVGENKFRNLNKHFTEEQKVLIERFELYIAEWLLTGEGKNEQQG